MREATVETSMGAELIVTHTEMTKSNMSFVADKMFYHGDQSILKHQILSHTNANHLCAVKMQKYTVMKSLNSEVKVFIC